MLKNLVSKAIYRKNNGKEAIKLLEASELFDELYYKKYTHEKPISNYIKHYLNKGYFQGIEPSEKFSSARYLDLHQDIDGSKINPLVHYLKYGIKEGRDLKFNIDINEDGGNLTVGNDINSNKNKVGTYFDKQFYLENNKDVSESDVEPIEHYLNFGWKEGRNPCSWFNVNSYLRLNEDVRISGVEPFNHYLEFGKSEKRPLIEKNSTFSPSIYDLKQLGASLYAPVIYSFLMEMKDYIKSNEIDTLYFLSREGYFLKKIYDFASSLEVVPKVKTVELMVSRAYMFRLLFSSRKDLDLALSSDFKGSLSYFLRSRFCQSQQEISGLGFTEDELNKEIKLPENKIYLAELLSKNVSASVEPSSDELSTYIKYLKSVGFISSKTPTVVDLGYAGTIQKALSLLTDKSVDGYYLLNSNKYNNLQVGDKECKIYGAFQNGKTFNDGEPMMDKSLILEGLLTAPYAQLKKVRELDGEFHFIRGEDAGAQENFYYLEAIVKGIFEFIEDVGLIKNDTNLIPDVKSVFDNETSSKNDFFELLELDDSVSGFGFINPNIVL
ncbi:hypothetical protein VCHA34P112_170108 [Vibrio chagasii]|nr:hypothetical protein VCHA34P112_170108 [Vibrio chagasii]CAH7016930.1 hypothetical protein VCHA56P515_170110 [Vibrio chagasii]CAH7054149.1 hypothetical protein VCHA53O463_170007 [Vibrio chagasii]